jgi:hypothetical protein
MRPVAKECDDSRVHWDVSGLAVLRITDDQEARVEVQIAPLKIADLSTAHAGVKGDRYDGSQMRSSAGLDGRSHSSSER